ncbi:MAG: hypothetical protein K0S33_1051 [Bacteroidetes bacterium]|jgi:putative lipoic acid-binding regulatory protein|nr:hypothetical protein [Bacteroidota bacterium]
MDKKLDFENLRKKLETEHTFPTVYMFKFIVPADNRKIALVESLFNEEAEIHQKQSSKGSYFSLTAKQVVISVDDIIAIYEKASEIEGLMAL